MWPSQAETGTETETAPPSTGTNSVTFCLKDGATFEAMPLIFMSFSVITRVPSGAISQALHGRFSLNFFGLLEEYVRDNLIPIRVWLEFKIVFPTKLSVEM